MNIHNVMPVYVSQQVRGVKMYIHRSENVHTYLLAKGTWQYGK